MTTARKQYPNVSDEELDRRGEEALKRMLQAPQTSHPSQNQGKPQQRQPGQPQQRQQRQRRRGGGR